MPPTEPRYPFDFMPKPNPDDPYASFGDLESQSAAAVADVAELLQQVITLCIDVAAKRPKHAQALVGASGRLQGLQPIFGTLTVREAGVLSSVLVGVAQLVKSIETNE